jgi:hypothetical protein
MKTMKEKLVFLAGERALKRVRDSGLDPDDVKIVAAAAGGSKWLILGQLDRLFFGGWFQDRTDPLFLLGSSIGSWRFAAASRRDPVAALDRFEKAYIHQAYATKPSPGEVTRKSRDIMEAYLGRSGVAEVLAHPFQRLSLFTVRSRHLLADDRKLPLALGLLGATGANLISRRLLRLFFRQTLFSDSRTPPPFKGIGAKRMSHASLDGDNFKTALLASGSIPYVMQGIRDIPGAPAGTYRDGGAVDYHLDIPYGLAGSGIVLFPHYTDRIIPGWLDKRLTWRKPLPDNMADVLLVAPSPAFVSCLPLGKISDRNDFYRFAGDDHGRFDYWQKVAAAGKELAEDFAEAVTSGSIQERVKPLL